MRGADLAWGTSGGRLGNIVGLLALGVRAATALAFYAIFHTQAASAPIAMVITSLAPRAASLELEPVPGEPTVVAVAPARTDQSHLYQPR